jgi:hypothetical protein
MNQPAKRGHWYLLTGLLLGLGLGLLYSWWINPAQYIDTEPASLASDYKDEYRKAIALAYQADQDIGRARSRALLVDPENPAREMAAQAQRLLSNNLSPREARALAVLAADLGQQAASVTSAATDAAGATAAANAGGQPSETPAGPDVLPTSTPDLAQAIQTATPERPSATPTVTLTPAPTFTPRPTATPPVVQDAIFAMVSNEKVCDASIQPGTLVIEVQDTKGQPLPGVRILISWDTGEEAFYTGLAPEISPGYSDFNMQPGVSYTIHVGEASDAYKDYATSGNCGWRLVFTQK